MYLEDSGWFFCVELRQLLTEHKKYHERVFKFYRLFHSAYSYIKLSDLHTTQTQTCGMRWAARFSCHCVVSIMSVLVTPKRTSHFQYFLFGLNLTHLFVRVLLIIILQGNIAPTKWSRSYFGPFGIYLMRSCAHKGARLLSYTEESSCQVWQYFKYMSRVITQETRFLFII